MYLFKKYKSMGLHIFEIIDPCSPIVYTWKLNTRTEQNVMYKMLGSDTCIDIVNGINFKVNSVEIFRKSTTYNVYFGRFNHNFLDNKWVLIW